MSVDNSSWTIERDYPHPPERVFTAWADPSIKVRWFDPDSRRAGTTTQLDNLATVLTEQA